MADHTVARPTALETWASVLSALVVPLPLLFGSVLEFALDTVNPAKVDVSQPLAYLRELIGYGFGFLGALLVVIAALILQLYRRDRSLEAARIPLLILGAQLVVGLALLGFNALGDGAEQAFR